MPALRMLTLVANSPRTSKKKKKQTTRLRLLRNDDYKRLSELIEERHNQHRLDYRHLVSVKK